MCEVLERIESKGRAEGRAEGEDRFAALVQKLIKLGRSEEIGRVSEDKEYRRKLMKDLDIK